MSAASSRVAAADARRRARRGSPRAAGTAASAGPARAPKAPSTPAAMNSGRGLRSSWPATSSPRFASVSVAARVTMMPVAVEISSAGICAARPSPIDSSEKVVRASPKPMPCCTMPIAMPPSRLIGDDDDAGDRVALDELRGAVHRAVEVGLALDLVAAAAGLVVGDLAGVEVGVDRHLLAGHGVEGEAGGDLGDAAGAVGDDHELDRRRGSGRRRGRRRRCRRPRTSRTRGSPSPRRRAAGSAA